MDQNQLTPTQSNHRVKVIIDETSKKLRKIKEITELK
jgi:hypothetical protein